MEELHVSGFYLGSGAVFLIKDELVQIMARLTSVGRCSPVMLSQCSVSKIFVVTAASPLNALPFS
jgi:hypothetical protein